MTTDHSRTGHSVSLFPALAVSTLLLAGISLAIMPTSHWELDEFLFRAGIESFEPLRHHPHPPGYPALIGLGRLFTAVTGDPFQGMRALAVVSTLVGFVAFAAAMTTLAGSATTGVAASSLFYFSCAMLVHSTTPMSDPPALAFLFVGVWAWSRARSGAASPWLALIMGAALAMSIGCRPQYAVAIVPGLIAAVAMTRSWRFAVVGLASFGSTCLTWLVPLVVATGGVRGFLEYELGQAAYVAAHDAELSRGWMSSSQVWERFVEHPWGGGGMSTFIFLLSAAGLALAVRRRMTGLVPLAVISTVHLAFTLATSDPGDAVRYALVFQPLLAALAALALCELDEVTNRRGVSLVVVTVFAVMSLAYAWPVLGPRSRGPSPPVRAITWIESNVNPNAVILYDNSLKPHAQALLSGWQTLPVEDGVREIWNRADVDVWILANGRSAAAGSRMFEWDGRDLAVSEEPRSMDVRRSWSKAYARLTRNHYGVVAVMPFPAGQRFLPGRGVYPIERSPRRREWRWLGPEASLTIPPGTGTLAITLHVPRDHPDESVDVVLQWEPSGRVESRVPRSESAVVEIPFPETGGEVVIRSGSSHVPGDLGLRDRRELSIQLLGVERVSAHDPAVESPVMMSASKE